MCEDLVPVLHMCELRYKFFTCDDLIQFFHRFEDFVLIVQTCEDLVPIHHICENLVPIRHTVLVLYTLKTIKT